MKKEKIIVLIVLLLTGGCANNEMFSKYKMPQSKTVVKGKVTDIFTIQEMVNETNGNIRILHNMINLTVDDTLYISIYTRNNPVNLYNEISVGDSIFKKHMDEKIFLKDSNKSFDIYVID